MSIEEELQHVAFKNPPVVEAWIEFHFSYGEEPPEWNEALADSLVKTYFGERFKVKDYLGATVFTVDESKGRPNLLKSELVLERVRAFSEAKDRCLQLGRDTLIYNVIRISGHEWPRYEVWREEAKDMYGTYARVVDPRSLDRISLHYRDIVNIPIKNERETIDMETYFKVHSVVPEETFGSITACQMSFVSPSLCHDGLTTVQIRTVPPPRTSPDHGGLFTFQVDWHVNSTIQFEPSLDRGALEWLNGAHQKIFDAFRSAFTDEGLRLFQ